MSVLRVCADTIRVSCSPLVAPAVWSSMRVYRSTSFLVTGTLGFKRFGLLFTAASRPRVFTRRGDPSVGIYILGAIWMAICGGSTMAYLAILDYAERFRLQFEYGAIVPSEKLAEGETDVREHVAASGLAVCMCVTWLGYRNMVLL